MCLYHSAISLVSSSFMQETHFIHVPIEQPSHLFVEWPTGWYVCPAKLMLDGGVLNMNRHADQVVKSRGVLV